MSAIATGKQGDIRFGGRDSVSGGGERDDWRTPTTLLADIYHRFGLNFDPCPYPRADWDGLERDWTGRAFVNPPYGKETGRWLKKAVKELRSGRCQIAVFLIHARTDTRWFHEVLMPNAVELHFVKGRVAFVGPNGKGEQSPFPSLIAVLTPDPFQKVRVSTWEIKDPSQTKLPSATEA